MSKGAWSPLIKVCVYCEANEKLDTSFLEKFIPLINTTTVTGSSPLHFVALGKNTHLALWLLENGALIVENEDAQTPLHWACKNGYLPMVQILLKNMTKKQILKKDSQDTSALDWAMEYKHFEIQLTLEEVNPKKSKCTIQEKHKHKAKFSLRRNSAQNNY